MLFAVNMLMATTKAKTSSFSPILIILYVVVFGSLYFFYIRPRSQKQKAARGFVGTVVKMDDGLITLRGASGVELDFIPTAIARKYNPPSSVPETADDDHEEEGDQK
jgi:preprotein translocase subunit YajC